MNVPDPFGDALLAARLCAIDPGLGGMILHGAGELAGAVIAQLRASLPEAAPIRRMPAHIDDDRLLGGIDLAASLAQGTAFLSAGLLAEADGGVVIIPMAERLSATSAGRIAAVMDSGEVIAERGALGLGRCARFIILALDDAAGPDEKPPVALADRAAFRIDLSEARLPPGTTDDDFPVLGGHYVSQNRAMLVPSDEALSALAVTAAALGIDSARAPLLALRAARANAVLAGRSTIEESDLTLAARLVLAPRATRMPMPPEEPDTGQPPPPPPESSTDPSDEESGEPGEIEDVVLEAALASLPNDVLAQIAAGGPRQRRAINASGGGERRKSGARGRPMGVIAGLPGGGRRLSLIDTLRAAVPWQKLRSGGIGVGDGRIKIRRGDLRVRRFETRAEALTIFVVDASGSSAVARLAEAKGAVELMLAEAYVKRAHVALVAFRGTTAELLLPPTRSLVRARRSLAGLPGGGGTPLAAGLNAARALAETARARGRTPFVVILTDGRANIAADGTAVRERAEADALAAARAIAAEQIAGAFVDISPRPRPEGAALAAAMRARYLPLPRADAAAMHRAITAVQSA